MKRKETQERNEAAVKAVRASHPNLLVYNTEGYEKGINMCTELAEAAAEEADRRDMCPRFLLRMLGADPVWIKGLIF